MGEGKKMNQYLTFTVSEEAYALNVLNVREVLEFTQLSKVPRMPEFMRGIINLRGSIVPVIDLKLKFGLGLTEKTIDTSIIVCEMVMDEETIVMGLMTDSVKEVIDLDDDDIEPTPYVGAKIDTAFILGMGKKDDKFLIVLNMEKVLTANELNMVSTAEISGE
ncbi:MAG: chemotaxis protein CheW [Spirochaetales bacterium]|nr:chemotaxis protein CheW [Spirochaetales bacterium]